MVEKVLGRLAENPELVDGLLRANMHTNMAGELFVRDIELNRTVSLQDPTDEAAFLDMDFPAARNHFTARGVMSPEEFEALEDAERFRAFRMAREVSDSVTEAAKATLNESMEPGGPGLKEFIRRVQEQEVSLGFAPNGPGYLENVYRTSTGTSYNAGRKRAQSDPSIRDAKTTDARGEEAPQFFLEYRTAGDGRVRDEHRALNGQLWPADQTPSVYPPNGYQCRCVMVLREREDLSPTQLAAVNRTSSARSELAQEGFRAAPDETIEQEAS